MKVRDKKNLLKYDDNKMNPFLGNFNISEINSPFFIFDRIKLKNLEFF